MMKKITIALCVCLLAVWLGASVFAETTGEKPRFDLTFSDGFRTVSNAGTDETGSADAAELTVLADAETLSSADTKLLRVNFDSDKFKFENARTNSCDGKLAVLSAWDESYGDYVLLSVTVKTPPEPEEDPLALITLTFSCTAAADENTAYSFFLSADEAGEESMEFGDPVTYTVSHVHNFSEWERYMDATEQESAVDFRTCKTCARTQYRQTDGVEYDISVSNNDLHISYDREKGCLHGMTAGITAKTLLTSLDITQSMQLSGAYPVVHDANGVMRKDSDVLKTGDVVALCGKSGTVHKALPIAILGDVNGDAIVSAADARLTLRISVHLDTPTPAQTLAADCDGTSGVAAADARLILRCSVKLDAFYPVALKELKVSPAFLEMLVGDTEFITVIYNPTDATDKKITYKTSDPSVAIVKNGIITAVGSGTATITVTGAGNKTASCSVNVQNVYFTREKFFLEEGKTLNLLSCLKAAPAGALSKAYLSLSNWNDFSVDGSGHLQCKTAYDQTKTKTTTVFLTLNTGRVLSVEVEQIPAGASICTFSMPSLRLIAGDSSFRLNSTIINGTQSAILSSSDQSVVAYDNATGKLTPLKTGTAVISCTNTRYSEKLVVHVVNAENMFHIIDANKVRDTKTNAWNMRIRFVNLAETVIDSVSFSVRPRSSAGETLDSLASTVSASSIEPHALNSKGVIFGWNGIWPAGADIDSFQIRQITIYYADGTVGYILGNGIKACAWD